jgi:hypothetical protein
MYRVIIALCGVAAAFAALTFWLDLGRHAGTSDQAALVVFVGVLAAGLPVLYRCCKRRLWSFWRCVALGTTAGALCALPFAGGPYGFGFLLMIYLVAGTACGMLFWMAALWRNDGLTCPKSFCLPCGTVYRFARDAIDRHSIQSK